MHKYSELPAVTQDAYEVPQTILDYKERMRANDRVSIFDDDYTFDELEEKNNISNKNLKSGGSKISLENETVIKLSCGRGRRIQGQQLRPGGFSMDDNDIREDLRRIAPLGYGNEITELTVKANQSGKNKKSNSIMKLPNQSQQTQSGENTSTLPMSKLLQMNKQKCEETYRKFLEEKEQQIWNEKMSTEKKIKELLEEDRRTQENLHTDLERSFDDFVGTDWRGQQTTLNSHFPWGKRYNPNDSWNIKSTSDFPPLSGGKKH